FRPITVRLGLLLSCLGVCPAGAGGQEPLPSFDLPSLAPSPLFPLPASSDLSSASSILPRFAQSSRWDVAQPPPERDRPWKVRNEVAGPLGSLTATSTLRAPEALRSEPFAGEEWHTDQSWRLNVAGPLSVFGQVGAGCDPVLAQER